MTDATLTAADRAALAALGFTLTGVSAWSIGAHSRSGAALGLALQADGDAAERCED